MPGRVIDLVQGEESPHSEEEKGSEEDDGREAWGGGRPPTPQDIGGG